ncbi:type 1 glutamine amidotransferase [Trueperella sp. LYQ143]|uniref:type 1 glutamine amidotransferase n=1 Tax=Trueperella sp. LYQ143 TaxID=3391059 RepID=UPI0039834D13
MNSALHIGVIDPEVLGTYGDTGNASVLAYRARARGIDAQIHMIHLDQAIPTSMDIYVMGGGEDAAQAIAAEHLRANRDFCQKIESGTPLLAICASLQILGNWYVDARNQRVEGLELLDITTSPQGHRSIGELVSEPMFGGLAQELTGFENHGGATSLGPDARPLGIVTAGTGNGGTTAVGQPGLMYDGVAQHGIIATYMHGPVLVRNPELADYLIRQATGMASLEELEMPLLHQLRAERIKAARSQHAQR